MRPPVRHTTVPPRRRRAAPPRRDVLRTLAAPEASLLDVIDSLLNKGVVLNADVVLALADVDLVYLRLSALLCAADRVGARTKGTSRRLRKRSRKPARTGSRTG